MAEPSKSTKVEPGSKAQTSVATLAGPQNAGFATARGGTMSNRALAQLFQTASPHHEREAENIASRIGSPAAEPPRVTAVSGIDPVPPSIQPELEAARANGSPLPPTLRGYMERHLGAELGAVRVHDSAAAQRMTEELNARAFTIGTDVYLNGASEAHDHVLLAHELVHVLQQRAGAAARIQRAPKDGGAQPATPATTADQRLFLEETIKHLHAAAEFQRTKIRIAAASKTKIKVDPKQVLGSWKSAIETDFKMIDSSLAGDVTLKNDLTAAYQDLVNATMEAVAEAENLSVRQALQKYKDVVHEVAWQPSAVEADANTLSDAIPKGERAKILVISTTKVPPSLFNLDELFAKKAGTKLLPPTGTDVVFSGSVAEDIKEGLKSVGAGLTTQVVTAKPIMPLNSTISLALDLTKYGSDYGLYRFTYYEHSETKKKKVVKSNILLIERLGKVGTEGLRSAAMAEAKKKFEAHKFTFTGNWKDVEKERVFTAVYLIADNILSIVDGVTFARGLQGGSPQTGANYDMTTHTINMFDTSFTGGSLARFGAPGETLATGSVWNTVHEIGHAIDRAKLRSKMTASAAARADLDKNFAQFKTPEGGFVLENVPLDVLREFNAALKKAKGAEAGVDKTITESGMRFQTPKGGGEPELKDDPKADTKFQKAAKGTRITPYAKDSWEEYFAESFALYITDPNTLKRLRPKIHEYFEDKFNPKKKAKKK